MGIYYLEAGANQRPSKVVYDREHSSISLAKPGIDPLGARLLRRKLVSYHRHYPRHQRVAGRAGAGGVREAQGSGRDSFLRSELSQEPVEVGHGGERRHARLSSNTSIS